MTHRDGSPGLFIGTSKLLFVLMNLAPAELLHPLIHAALQPHLITPLFLHASRSRVDHDGGPCKLSPQALAAVIKKNASSNAGVGMVFRKNKQVFQEKSCLARQRRGRQPFSRSIRSSTVH